MIMLLLEDQIEHNKYLALHDELTGLPNRRLFQDRLAGAIERARRTGTHVALLLIDLDNFKLVNDTAGHHVGDQLLKHVGNLFTGRVRRSDTVARTGGDEFSVILEEPMTRADAARVGKILTKLLDEPFDLRRTSSSGRRQRRHRRLSRRRQRCRISAHRRRPSHVRRQDTRPKGTAADATSQPPKRKPPHRVKATSRAFKPRE